MNLFQLSNDDRGKLQRLNKQQDIVTTLKKLFLNVATKGTLPDNVQVLAAERIAIDIIEDAFHLLEIKRADSSENRPNVNTI